MNNLQLPRTELAWLAGIFDGEGSARIYRSKTSYFAQVSAVSNTDPLIIERVIRDLDALGLQGKYHKRRDTNLKQPNAKVWWKACGDIRVTGYDQATVYLTAILPFTTGSRKVQAEAVLAFIRMRKARGCKLGSFPRKGGRPQGWLAEDEAHFQSQPFLRGRNDELRVN